MSKKGLRSGIIQILFANVLNMLFSFGTNFLLPKYLSVDSYSQIKTYQLYITYVAVLHFGYNDGMYLKFGGKKLENISTEELQENLSTLKIFQLIVMILSVVIAVALQDMALLMSAIAILPQNLIAYYKNFYQATGEFKKYSRIMNLTTGLTFVINLILIVVFKTDNYIIYLSMYVILLFVLWGVLEYSLYNDKKINIFLLKFSWKEIKINVSIGILLLLGNFSSQILTSMDRWFVKVLLGTVAFAQYAFAVSMENFLNVAVTPISVTLYNYFCNHDETQDIKYIREIVMAFSACIVATAFPVKFILEIYLQKYLDSVSVVFILFSAQIFYIVIKGVYVNLYKARKMQKRYFTKLCFILVIAFVFNVVCYQIYHIKESFAIGTLLSAIVWFFISQLDFRELNYNIRHYAFLSVEVITYVVCGIKLQSIEGFLIYMLVTIIMIKVCIPNAFGFGIKTIKDTIKKIRI